MRPKILFPAPPAHTLLFISICFLCASVSDAATTIRGTVFVDADGNGLGTPDEGLPQIAIQLYRDNGDGQFGSNDILLPLGSLTNEIGEYRFDDLDPDAGYFVSQSAQMVGGQPIAPQMSGLMEPGRPNMIIDTFLISQNLTASPHSIARSSMVDEPSQSQILGHQRDAYLEYYQGIAEVKLRANPFSLDTNLHFDTSAGVTGMAVVTWDGMDNSAGMTPAMGLNGMDLTHGGENTGIMLRMGTDSAGDGQLLTLRMFAGNPDSFAEALVPIPITGGLATGFTYVPFSSFSGEVDPTHVDALQMVLDATIPSVDAQFDLIGAIGPKVQDFSVTLVPEPATALLLSVAAMALIAAGRRRK